MTVLGFATPTSDVEVFLSIGIPTYRREESVLQLLNLLATVECTVQCEVLVINNGPYLDLSAQREALLRAGYIVNILQNRVNCGGQENALRVYEFALGRYVWYLGDDDRFYVPAFKKVVELLLMHEPDCLLLNADTPGETLPSYPSGVLNEDQVFGGHFALGRLICAPLNVLRRDSILQSLPRARLFLGCFAPQFLLVLLGNVRTFFYLNEPTLHQKDVPVVHSQKLSVLPIFLGIGGLMDVPSDPARAVSVRRLLKREWRTLISPLHVLGSITIDEINGRKHSYFPFFRAGLKCYPCLLSLGFAVSLLVLKVVPKKSLLPLLHWYANTVKKRGIDTENFRSWDRI